MKRHWFPLVLALLLALPATAADVVYPPGSRVGIAPPPGLTPSMAFFGFQDAENKVAMILGALPADAYAELERTATPETLQKQGVVVDKREDLSLPGGKAFLVTAHQAVDNVTIRKWLLVAAHPDLTAMVNVQMPEQAQTHYPDAVIRASLETLSVRGPVPLDEQLSLLPFRLSDLAGFHVAAVLPGRAVVLSDSAAVGPAAAGGTDPHMFVAALPGSPEVNDRNAFAREAFATIPNISDIRITTSEPLRIGGLQGHQIMATAKDGASGTDVTVVQWLRFGTGGYMQFVGVASTKDWTPAYTRFRSVRDSLETQ